MSVAAFTNSRLVMHFGMRRLAIIGLGALVSLNLAHLALVWAGFETLPVFVLMQAGSMFVFGFLVITSYSIHYTKLYELAMSSPAWVMVRAMS